MSECITATCPHGRGVFIGLGAGPGGDGRYPWVHGGRMDACDLMPAATAEEAGEACARCGCGSHEHAPRACAPFWVRPEPGEPDSGPCSCGDCPGMVYGTTALGRQLIAERGRAA